MSSQIVWFYNRRFGSGTEQLGKVITQGHKWSLVLPDSGTKCLRIMNPDILREATLHETHDFYPRRSSNLRGEAAELVRIADTIEELLVGLFGENKFHVNM